MPPSAPGQSLSGGRSSGGASRKLMIYLNNWQLSGSVSRPSELLAPPWSGALLLRFFDLEGSAVWLLMYHRCPPRKVDSRHRYRLSLFKRRCFHEDAFFGQG